MVPPPAAGDMMCPQVVQENERALGYWTMYLANVAPGHLSPIDAPLLARLCMALAYADQANESIEESGLVVNAPNTGFPIQSPYLAVLNRQTEIARKLASELALPPAERNRVGPYTPEKEGPSPWDALEP
ncbi:MAG: P27 family phage terminase small subunit [Acetobacteraceae bacterium]|nr:P27 family phage terminase small subunit [Acetobacteraceae bacterium]